MGLFDTVIGKFFCPFCGAKVEDFQTKDLDPILNVYKLGKYRGRDYPSVELHAMCDKCKSWISLNVGKSRLKLIKGKTYDEISKRVV